MNRNPAVTTPGVVASVHGPLQDLVAHSDTDDHAEAVRRDSPLFRYLGGRSPRVFTDVTLSVDESAALVGEIASK